MTTTAMLDKTADHPEIWLEPKSDDYDSEGRMWCQDNQWGTEGVRYVLAPLSHAAGDVAGLCEMLRECAEMTEGGRQNGLTEFWHEETAKITSAACDSAATTLLAISARAEAAEAGSDEAIMQERESCAFAVECHSGFGDPATIEACAQIIRDRSDPSLRSDSVHLTPERYAELLAAEARVKEMEAVCWQPIESAPTGWHNYFFIRPTGLYLASGKPFLPTIVQQVDGQFYESDNELDPVYFGQDEPEDSPFKQNLEWRPIPANWFAPSDLRLAARSLSPIKEAGRG